MRGRQVVVITGFDGSRADVEAAADAMQQAMARGYEGSRTGAGALRANTREYEVRKILDGDDPRRGHKTGALQDALYSVRCWRVQGSQSSGTWTITFGDNPLRAAVGDYVEYFAAAKAVGGVVVTMNRSYVDAGMAVLERRARPARRQPLRARERDVQDLLEVAAGVAVRRSVRRGVGRTGVRVA